MTKKPTQVPHRVHTHRRDVLRWMSTTSLLPLVPMIGCGASESNSGSGGRVDPGSSHAGLFDPWSHDAEDAGGPPPPGAVGHTAGGWATGGTAAMTGKAGYPDPFVGAPLDSCDRFARSATGPCPTLGEIVREDVSEGWTGLPVRLALMVVDRHCRPLPGVSVKIWHSNIEGSYSGQTPVNWFCLQDQAYASSNFFRGVQTTDAEGKVYFDTCFPGWYPGRAVHIHVSMRGGSILVPRVTQLYFREDLTQEIFAEHSEYAPYGQPDTVFANDLLMAGLPNRLRERVIVDVAQMSDGAMLASKILAA